MKMMENSACVGYTGHSDNRSTWLSTASAPGLQNDVYLSPKSSAAADLLSFSDAHAVANSIFLLMLCSFTNQVLARQQKRSPPLA